MSANSAVVGASGERHPSKLLGDREAAELASFNYVSGCMLDVTTYREAMEKFGEETDVQEKQWRTLQETCWQPYHIAYGHAAERCCVLGTTPAGWYEEEQDLVGKGCDCQCCAPAELESHPGGNGFGHMSSECVRIVHPRDCEENTLDAIAQSLESCLA